MNTLYKFAKLIMFASMAIFVAGCKEEDEEEGLPKVIAGFTYSVNVNTGTVTFINTSTDATKYLWNFGNETTSTEINPIKTFVSGTYNVKLKASNASGASNTVEDVLTIQITSKPALPITFDISTVNYTPTVFQGAQFEVVENPSASGSNNKASKVGAITNSGVAFEGLFYDLGAAIDLATNKRIRMNFRSEVPVSVLLKLEGTTPSIENTANHGGTGWESISFDFSSSSKYSKLTLFVDGPGTTAGTFYFDDVVQEAIPVPPLTCTEETVQSISAADFNLTFKTDPSSSIISDNAGFEWVNNPDEEDLNKSCKVGKIARTAASLFANNQINLDAKLDFTANSGFKMKVYSDVTGFKVLLKLEDKVSSGTFTELEVTTTKTNEWEELTFPFASNQTNKYDKIIIFFDLNTSREKTYYFDDLRLYTGSGSDTQAPVITLVGSATVNLNLGGPLYVDAGATATDNKDGNITSSIVTVGVSAVNTAVVGTYLITYNVSDAAGNAATQVTRTVIVAPFDDGLLTNGDFQSGASPWLAGVGTTPAPVVTMGGDTYYSVNITSPDPGQPFLVNLSQKLSLTAGQNYTLTFDAWSDRARTIIAGIGRSGGDFANVNQTFNITTTRTTYTVTFNNIGFGEADNRVLFDNNGQAGVVNIDNVKLVVETGSGGGSCPTPPAGEFIVDGGFEANAGCWELIAIQAGTSSTIVTNVNNGGANSARIKTAPAANPAIKQTRFGVGDILTNTTYVVKFDVRQDAADPVADGAVFKVAAFSEAAEGSGTGAVRHDLIPGDGSVPGTWTTRTLTFTTPGTAANVAGGLSLLIELVGGGATTTGTIYIDNVSLTKQ